MGIFRKKEKKIKPTHNEFAGFTGDYKVVTGVSYVIMIGLCILACGFVFEKQIQSPAIWVIGLIIMSIGIAYLFIHLYIVSMNEKRADAIKQNELQNAVKAADRQKENVMKQKEYEAEARRIEEKYGDKKKKIS